ncbi:polysaccharide deacetylase family protein [Paenibacillus cymbidii]|uniref:hypothetical protein n=1 Tax=Paenibacillus cymbidii TaxID=1639034 RepID=UPI00108221B9|nr:hypothetical protein [Paenibacillus cymbidii]
MRIARLGIVFDKTTAARKWRYGINAYQIYLREIMSHAGFTYDWIEDSRSWGGGKYDIVIAALADDHQDTLAAMYDYVRDGGRLIAYGGLNALADQFGFRRETPIASGYADASDETFGVPVQTPLRYLHAAPWTACGEPAPSFASAGTIRALTPHGEAAGDLLQRIRVGAGSFDRWSVDIPQTIVRMQQGARPVLEDGIPAADGSVNVNDGILKADDAIAFDYEFDRLVTATGNPYFAVPQADLWRELLVSHVIATALSLGLTLPFVGMWPGDTEHALMISHDSDGNEDVHALAALELLAETGVRSTWCMLEPGYSPGVYEKVKAAGHELAFHFNSLREQGGSWEGRDFARQLEWLRRAADLPAVLSNKNHYTRFEGWSELFDWCEKEGVQSDQTRGPSKRGNVGFLFGTCQPYFPMAWANESNRLHDVLEIGFLTQDMDLGNWADSSIIVPFLEQVERIGGVAHFLFHQVHIHNQEKVREAFRLLIATAKARGFALMTGAEVNRWHRERRKARIAGMDAAGFVLTEQAAPGTVVWIPIAEETLAAPSGDTAVRFGHRCRKQAAVAMPRASGTEMTI